MPESCVILPSQHLRRCLASGVIHADAPLSEDQIQPASVDLRLGPRAWRMRTSLLPGLGATVAQKIEAFQLYPVDLSDGAVLERNCVYIVPLLESVALDPDISGVANPKSSTGRLDVFARVITDGGVEFDQVPAGYRGPLYVEISPRAFAVKVHHGSRLVQLRLRCGAVAAGPVRGGLAVTVDTVGDGEGAPVGYRALKHTGVIDVERIGYYDASEFWAPVLSQDGRGLILDPSDFYILASKEAVTVPADCAAEMLPYDTLVGEFRVHYAGFFDPGFGTAETGGAGSRAVLEVRAHEVPFLVEDGQVVGRLLYERLEALPDKLYGTGIGSSYQKQGLRLGKQFRAV
jgi:dCTP deaminase